MTHNGSAFKLRDLTRSGNLWHDVQTVHHGRWLTVYWPDDLTWSFRDSTAVRPVSFKCLLCSRPCRALQSAAFSPQALRLAGEGTPRVSGSKRRYDQENWEGTNGVRRATRRSAVTIDGVPIGGGVGRRRKAIYQASNEEPRYRARRPAGALDFCASVAAFSVAQRPARLHTHRATHEEEFNGR